MFDDMVMRSVYLRPAQDAQLRQLAHELNVTKSDLIRSAISVKLAEWLTSNDRERIMKDVEHGLRDEEAIRSGRRGRRRAAAGDAKGKTFSLHDRRLERTGEHTAAQESAEPAKVDDAVA